MRPTYTPCWQLYLLGVSLEHFKSDIAWSWRLSAGLRACSQGRDVLRSEASEDSEEQFSARSDCPCLAVTIFPGIWGAYRQLVSDIACMYAVSIRELYLVTLHSVFCRACKRNVQFKAIERWR